MVVFFLAFVHFSVVAQKNTFRAYEDSLKFYFDKIASTNERTEKEAFNVQIIQIFNTILSDEASFEYPFDSLKYLGKMTSDDKLLRIYNWNLSFIDGTFAYFGFLQYYNKEKKKFQIYPLIDKRNEITDPKNEILTPDRWLGVLYYEIVTHTVSKKKYYTLLGWDGNDLFTNKKVVEILSFSGSGVPRFGAPIIRAGTKTFKRLIFEYSNRAAMTLSYFPDDKRLVFDHLSPTEPKFKDMYQFYGPDFSYDSFVLKKGKWYFEGDIDFRNPDDFNKQTKPNKGL